MPVIPANREVVAGASLEPGGRSFSEPRLHHCTPAWAIEQDSLSKKKKRDLGGTPSVYYRPLFTWLRFTSWLLFFVYFYFFERQDLTLVQAGVQ